MDDACQELPGPAVEHISQMLTLAESKHQEAMALLGTPDPNVLPRLTAPGVALLGHPAIPEGCSDHSRVSLGLL